MITFNDTGIFTSIDGLSLAANMKIEVQMPKQLPRDAIVMDKKAVQDASLAAMGVSIVLGFFFSAVINQMLAIVENICIILHMFILTLEYPIHVMDFFGAMFPLITFDLFPTDELYESMFHWEENDIDDDPIND